MSDERAERVKRYLEWIAPEGGLEAMAGEPTLVEGLADVPWATAVDAERAGEAVRRVQQGNTLTPEQTSVIEAIVLPRERPVVDIVDGTYATPARAVRAPRRRRRARHRRGGDPVRSAGSSSPTTRRCPTAAPASSSATVC